MRIFQTFQLIATIILLCEPIYSFSQSKTQQTIVNGVITTVTIDSLTVFKEDSVLKNTHPYATLGDSTSAYELRERRLAEGRIRDYVAELKEEESRKKQKEEKRRATIRLTLWLAIVLIMVRCSYLVYGEYNGGYPNSFGRGFLTLGNNGTKIIQRLKKAVVKLFIRRKCPFCKSSINAKATVCRHCLRNISF